MKKELGLGFKMHECPNCGSPRVWEQEWGLECQDCGWHSDSERKCQGCGQPSPQFILCDGCSGEWQQHGLSSPYETWEGKRRP